MTPDLADALDLRHGPSNRVYGVVTGIVTNNKDDQHLGRVKVRFPWLSGSDESAWARLAAPMAGPQAGTYFLPEVDDEVLVAFEHGDVRYPYVIGSLWRSSSPPPERNDDGKNAKRVIRTKAGLTLTFDDTQGAERIVIADKSGRTTITLDAAQETVVVEGADVTVRAASGALTLEGPDVTVRAKSGALTLEGLQVKVAGQTSLKVESGGTLDLQGATTAVKGTPVRLG